MMTEFKTKTKTYKRTNQSFEEVFAGEYEVDLIEPPNTVLDIGANEGAFTAWASVKWPQSWITAYEPMPFNADLFRENHGHKKNVVLYELAISNSAISNSNRVEIFLGANNSGECSAHQIGEQSKESRFVSCCAPSMIGRYNFVKLDAEGCEIEILQGLDVSATNAIVLEYHRDSDCIPIRDLLVGKGFELFYCQPRCKDRGIMKFARPGTRSEPPTAIPNETRLSGNTPDGKLVTLTAGNLRNEHYLPEFSGKSLFIGLPIHGSPTVSFMQCLLALQVQKPLPIQIQIGCGDGVGRTRNILTAAFLKSKCTHLLFIDSDLIFNVGHIVSLLRAKQPMVCGFYPKKQEGPLEWVVNTLTPHPEPRPDRLQAIKYAGTGFLLIERQVFEKMIEDYPEIQFREDYGDRELAYDFWSMGAYRDTPDQSKMLARQLLFATKNKGYEKDKIAWLETISDGAIGEARYLSEDWYFCQRWIDIGGEIFAHTGVVIRHQGQAVYPLKTQLPEIAHPFPPKQAV